MRNCYLAKQGSIPYPRIYPVNPAQQDGKPDSNKKRKISKVNLVDRCSARNTKGLAKGCGVDCVAFRAVKWYNEFVGDLLGN